MLYKINLLPISKIPDENQPVMGFQRHYLPFSCKLATKRYFISSLELFMNPTLY